MADTKWSLAKEVTFVIRNKYIKKEYIINNNHLIYITEKY